MSIKVMSMVWQTEAKLSGSELLVLLAMADYADDNGGTVYPSMASLGKKSRMSADQARRVIKKLVDMKLVEIIRRGGWRNGHNLANEYRLNLANIAQGYSQDARSLQDASTPKNARSSRGRKDSTPSDASTVPPQMQDQSPLEPPLHPPLVGEVVTETLPTAIERTPTPQQELFGAVAEAVGWDLQTLSSRDRGQLAQTVGALAKAGYSVADVGRFMTEVWFRDWRWEKNSSYPTLNQLRQEIGKLRSVIRDHAPPAGAGRSVTAHNVMVMQKVMDEFRREDNDGRN